MFGKAAKRLESFGVQSGINSPRGQSGVSTALPSSEEDILDIWTRDRDELVRKKK